MSKNEFICDCNAVNTELVSKIQSKMLDDSNFKKIADFYKIISDTTRCKIIFALQKSELCVCDLAYLLSMTKSSISHQLSKMKDCGIVKCRRDGKEVYYSLDDEHVSKLFKLTVIHINHKRGE